MGIRVQREHTEQVALFVWCRAMTVKYPDLSLLFAVPNGGARYVAVARKLKAAGVKPGVPDVCLPVVRGPYHGLFIELKINNRKATPRQSWWLRQLLDQGYCARVANGFEEAKQIILHYLEIK